MPHAIASSNKSSHHHLDQPQVLKKPKTPKDPFQESVYALVPRFVQTLEKPTLHQSVYAPLAKKEWKKGEQRVGVIGPAHVKKEVPSEWLKKGQGEKWLNKAKEEAQQQQQQKAKAEKNRLPLWEPTKPKATPIHFERRKSAPERPQMVYREKKDYGRSPAYLDTIKSQLLSQKEKQELLAKEQLVPKDYVVLSEEERVRILDGLQKNWEKLNTEYQKLPLVIDTHPKITRKIYLDKQLKKVEDDIKKFSHKNIIIKIGSGASNDA